MDAIDRQILELRKQSLGYKAIAKTVGMSVGGVRKRIAKLEGALGCSEGVLDESTTAQEAHGSKDCAPEDKKDTEKRNN